MANNYHKPQQLRMLFSYWKFAKKVAFDILSSQLREVVCQIWSHKGNWQFALKRSLQRNDNFVDHLGPTSDCHLLVSWENIFICNKNSWLHFLILRTLLKQNNALLSVRYRRCISTFLNNLWFRPSKTIYLLNAYHLTTLITWNTCITSFTRITCLHLVQPSRESSTALYSPVLPRTDQCSPA